MRQDAETHNRCNQNQIEINRYRLIKDGDLLPRIHAIGDVAPVFSSSWS